MSRDPWESMPGGTTWDYPRYLVILSTMGTIWDLLVCDTGVSCVSRDVPSFPRTSHGSTGHPRLYEPQSPSRPWLYFLGSYHIFALCLQEVRKTKSKFKHSEMPS